MKEKVHFEYADHKADEIIKLIAPYCTRMKKVGSLGRLEDQIGDIDLLVKPVNVSAIGSIELRLRRIGKWNRGGERQMTVDKIYDSPLKLDLFLCHPPAQWGVLVADRLNPKELVIWAKAKLDKEGYKRGGATIFTPSGEELNVPEESDWFNILGIDWCEPEKRYELCERLGIKIERDGTDQ